MSALLDLLFRVLASPARLRDIARETLAACCSVGSGILIGNDSGSSTVKVLPRHGVLANFDGALVTADNAHDRRQSPPSAGELGREKWIEYPLSRERLHPAPVINLTGDYIWWQARRVEKGKFRPVRPFAQA